MKAVILTDFDREPAYTDVPTPEPGPNEVRIRVRASSVNGFDVSMADGNTKGMMEHEFPVTLGRDYAGVIDQVGDGVTRYAVGDEVFGFVFTAPLHEGAWAEYLVVPEDMFVSPKPARLGLPEAGALALAGVAALKAVDGIDPAKGDRILIVGATGGVGGYAVQLAVARGAHVIATATAEDDSRVRGLGAQETVDFTKDDVARAVRERYPDGVDALIDLVTPTDLFRPMAELVRDGGRIGTTTGAGDADALRARDIALTGVWASAEPETLARLGGHADSGQLDVSVGKVYPLAEAATGIADFRTGTHGKIGISIGD